MTLHNFFAAADAERSAVGVSVRVDSRLSPLYEHAVAFESWRQHLLTHRLGSGLPFWIEAQNDFLLALMHAGDGVWRSSLQSLRSFVENATGALFYQEHSVEAKMFALGSHRLSWTETKAYFDAYPREAKLSLDRMMIDSLGREYAELSRAVHGSSESYRMTASQAFPKLCSSDTSLVGKWSARANACARAIHLLYCRQLAADLVGARLPALREDVGRVLSDKDRATVLAELAVVLPEPK